MKKGMLTILLTVSSFIANAGVIEYDNFGQFNSYDPGSGIPNDAVATTNFDFLGETFTLGLTATERCGNPEVTNDGAGTFTASAGSNIPYCSGIEGASWNFGYFFGMAGNVFSDFDDLLSSLSNENFMVKLSYDVDPSNNEDYGVFKLSDFLAFYPDNSEMEDSQNMMFGWLSNPAYVLPAIGNFNPNSAGTYNFRMDAMYGQDMMSTVAIDVDVVGVPEPSTLAIFALGMIGLISRQLKKQR